VEPNNTRGTKKKGRGGEMTKNNKILSNGGNGKEKISGRGKRGSEEKSNEDLEFRDEGKGQIKYGENPANQAMCGA